MKLFLVALFVLLFFINFKAKAQHAYKLYGGKNHDVFLGCNCENDELHSIWNLFSDYSSTHNSRSIWNERGIYGSKTSDYSPFNIKAKYPPLILDEVGKSHGYLTINKNYPGRANDSVSQYICAKRDEIVNNGVYPSEAWFKRVY